MQAAFYKSHHGGIIGLFDILIKVWEEGEYSHCVLLFSDGVAGSAAAGSGVSLIPAGTVNYLDATQWDLIKLPSFFDESKARSWFESNQGKGYDYWGDAHFVDGLIHHEKNHFFCSEAVADALLFKQGWRFDPNALATVLNRLSNIVDNIIESN